MKASPEPNASPIASFVEGLNSTDTNHKPNLDGVGMTARVLKQLSALALVVLIVPMGNGDLFAQSAPPPPQQYQNAPPQQYQGAPPPPPQGEGYPDQNAPPQQYQNAPPQQYQNAPPQQYQNAPPQQYQNAPPQQYQNAPPQQYQGAPPPPPQAEQYPDQDAEPQDQGPPPQNGAPPSQPGQANSEQGAPPDYPGAAAGQPLTTQQLDQMVAPIALYPDALVAQVLAASTYPSEVVEADRWLQAQGNMPPEQLAAAANGQNWDPSVKALVAFPSVLAQMDKNVQWTTDLGNAYYNQPQDVMSAVQSMRQRAQSAGTLRSTPQQSVTDQDGDIIIAPSNPDVVYVPTYNPWMVYGAPFGYFPGYYYGPSAGVYFGSGLAIGFGVGIGIGVYSNWGWGYHHWHPDWRNRTVFYNRNRYYTRSRTVYNRGFNRPGGPPRGYSGNRGAYNRGVQGTGHGGSYNRGAAGHPSQGNFNRGGAPGYSQGGNRGGSQPRPAGRPSGGGNQSGGASHAGGGGHVGGGGGHAGGGGGGHGGGGGGHH